MNWESLIAERIAAHRDTGDGPKYEVYCRLDQERGRYILRDEYAQHECKGFEPRGSK